MNLRLARLENAELAALNEFFGFNFQVNRDAASAVDGERGWSEGEYGFEIARLNKDVSRPTIGKPNATVRETRYVACYGYEEGGFGWEPPSVEVRELGDHKSLFEAALACKTELLRWEFLNKQQSEAEDALAKEHAKEKEIELPAPSCWVKCGDKWVDIDDTEFLNVEEGVYGDKYTVEYEGERYESLGVMGYGPPG